MEGQEGVMSVETGSSYNGGQRSGPAKLWPNTQIAPGRPVVEGGGKGEVRRRGLGGANRGG